METGVYRRLGRLGALIRVVGVDGVWGGSGRESG